MFQISSEPEVIVCREAFPQVFWDLGGKKPLKMKSGQKWPQKKR